MAAASAGWDRSATDGTGTTGEGDSSRLAVPRPQSSVATPSDYRSLNDPNAGRLVTSFADFRAVVRSVDAPARVPAELAVPVDDPYAAYRRVRDDEGSVYLETTGDQDGWGYFATEPIDRIERLPGDEGDSLGTLDDRLRTERLARGECDVPYPCGAFGWLSYDVARETEDLPDTTTDDRGLPRLQFAVYDRVAAWRSSEDAPGITLRVTSCPRVAPGDDVRAAYERAVAHAGDLVGGVRTEAGQTSREPSVDRETAAFEPEIGRAEYERRVRRVKEYVREGDTFQANVSHRLVAPAAVHPVDVFGALRRRNPAPYSALVEFPGVSLVSASPELLLDVNGDRLVTEPIAGTRPRGATPAADAAHERALRGSEKERAEHAMLVDLQRNDLGKVSEYGSVDVEAYRRVDRYSEVMHTVSVVTGTRRRNASVLDAVEAVFPGGTITGAPKPRTMEIIDEVESTRRGPYTGSIGVFGFDERATLNMAIRTLVERGDRYYLRVGAGIVHDSDPSEEYDETLNKGRALVDAVDDALGSGTYLTVTAGAEDAEDAGDDGGAGNAGDTGDTDPE